MEPWIPVIFPEARSWLPIVLGGICEEHRKHRRTGHFRRNGPLDIGSSVILIAITLWLIADLIRLAANH